VDTSPDLREQCLREGIKKIDAIIYTHAHADHLHGIDDTRSFNFTKDAPIDTYSDEKTLEEINKRFGYAFMPAKPAGLAWYRPALTPHVVVPYQSVKIGDIEVLPIEQQHGQSTTLGLRFGKFAYSTDTNGLSEQAIKALTGIDTWIVDCLRYKIAPTHAHLEMTLGWIKQVKPRKAYLTHLNHEFDYDTLMQELPDNAEPAYDGLKLEV
jgi:phosphoribosyl 1,2-cyclic phosphate phosphodiesterase